MLLARALLAALRPRQWTKNGLIFVALAFTLNLRQPGCVVRAIVAFVCFCALSSAGYLLNDVLDAEADRQHPTKRSGQSRRARLPAARAQPAAGVLALVRPGAASSRAAAGRWWRPGLSALLTAVYSTTLKHMVLLDIFGARRRGSSCARPPAPSPSTCRFRRGCTSRRFSARC